MSKDSPKETIQLKLTECQKEQIRKATGRTVSSLELRLEALPATPPCGDKEANRAT